MPHVLVRCILAALQAHEGRVMCTREPLIEAPGEYWASSVLGIEAADWKIHSREALNEIGAIDVGPNHTKFWHFGSARPPARLRSCAPACPRARRTRTCVHARHVHACTRTHVYARPRICAPHHHLSLSLIRSLSLSLSLSLFLSLSHAHTHRRGGGSVREFGPVYARL